MTDGQTLAFLELLTEPKKISVSPTWTWAAGRDADQRAGEAIEHEDDGADEADGGGQAQVELVVHIGSLEAVGLPAHDGGDVDNVKHGHDDDEHFFCLYWWEFSGGVSVSCLTKCGTMDAGASQGGSFKI